TGTPTRTSTPTGTATSTPTASPTSGAGCQLLPLETGTPTFTPSPTPSATPSRPVLYGHLCLPAARGSQGSARWVPELFRGASGGIAVYPANAGLGATPIATYSATTDSRGSFSVVLTGLAPGSYDVGVRGNNTLENRRVSINPSASSSGSPYDFGTL